MLISFWGPHVETPHSRAFARMAEELDLPIITYGGPKLDVIHPTSEGYRGLAQEIFHRFEGENWLDGERD